MDVRHQDEHDARLKPHHFTTGGSEERAGIAF
jgi:hypothetical protein